MIDKCPHTLSLLTWIGNLTGDQCLWWSGGRSTHSITWKGLASCCLLFQEHVWCWVKLWDPWQRNACYHPSAPGVASRIGRTADQRMFSSIDWSLIPWVLHDNQEVECLPSQMGWVPLPLLLPDQIPTRMTEYPCWCPEQTIKEARRCWLWSLDADSY